MKPPWLLALTLNSLAVAVLVALLFNFAYAPWSWDPVEDLLYVRSAGFILPANHVSSALAVGGTTLYFMLSDMKGAVRVGFVIMSTASVHEYILDALNWTFSLRFPDYILTPRWVFWLGFILVPGVFLATRRERKTLALVAAFCAVYISAWFVAAIAFNVDTMTILGYAPGSAYYSPLPNLFETSSWVVPSSFWWLRR